MATDVLISIATMNSRAYLRGCLESLPEACRGLRWQAVVVDNCSSDGTAEMVRDFPEVELLRNAVARGFGANHNRVLHRVLDEPDGPRFILVLNDDTVLHPDAVVALVRSASVAADIGAVTPAVVDAAGLRHPTAFPPSSPWLAVPTALGVMRADPRIAEGDAGWLDGCCLLISVDALRVVGGFDERFYMYSEDVDMSFRLRAAGFRLRECPESTITHYGQATTSQAERADAMVHQPARSFYQFLAKHYGVPTATGVTFGIRAALGIRGIAKVLAGAVSGDPRRTMGGRQLLRRALRSPRHAAFPLQERPQPLSPSGAAQTPLSPGAATGHPAESGHVRTGDPSADETG